uniref:Nucleosome assembly protein 1-like 1 n=1 Tax=Eptatretus burgeri TaxID=7764 RepID=A0A8C4RFF1_EPTBU
MGKSGLPQRQPICLENILGCNSGDRRNCHCQAVDLRSGGHPSDPLICVSYFLPEVLSYLLDPFPDSMAEADRKCAEAAEEIEYDESAGHDEDEDDEDEDDDDEGDEPINSAKRANGKARLPVTLSVEMLQDPGIVAALKQSLDDMAGSPAELLNRLPASVKLRVSALRRLQANFFKLQAEFFQDVHRLQLKYSTFYQSFYSRRRDIVNGIVEPTDTEAKWLLSEKNNSGHDQEDEREAKGVTGIPGFWLTTMKNVDLLADMIQEYDEPILQHIQDIKLTFPEGEKGMTFALEFHFAHNDYFRNEMLSKTYMMHSHPVLERPLGYQGPTIISCKGCPINWREGRDVTAHTVQEHLQKHRSSSCARRVTRSSPTRSFFSFFNPPHEPLVMADDMDEEEATLLATDFEMGQLFRERLIPRAVLYFTGEILDDYDDDDTEESDFDEEKAAENDEDKEEKVGPEMVTSAT